jgi:hypothetical protein
MGCALDPIAERLSPQTHRSAGAVKNTPPCPEPLVLFGGERPGVLFPGAAAVGLRRERDQDSFPKGNTPEMEGGNENAPCGLPTAPGLAPLAREHRRRRKAPFYTNHNELICG